MTENHTSEVKMPNAQIKFIFNHCNDVKAMRRFYGELIGLKETAFNEEWGYLCFRTGGLDFMYFQSTEPVPVVREFASQPGYEGGTLSMVSWAIEVPEPDFAAAVKRLKDAGVTSFNDKPDWRQDSYWGYSVLDPMGMTVEVYVSPTEKPENKEWIED